VIPLRELGVDVGVSLLVVYLVSYPDIRGHRTLCHSRN
jgi:hypothetical protein